MSDPEDEIDQHRDEALNGLIRTIDATGGLVTVSGKDMGLDSASVLVPKGDTEREWTDLADAYLNACKAMGVQPFIDGKRAPRLLKITVQVARSVKDDISDVENENETELLHGLFEKLPEDLEVAVIDCDGVYLYDAHREV